MAEAPPNGQSKYISDEIKKIEERIRRRAYDIFRSNGGVVGMDLEHWLQAEHELVWRPAIELQEKDDEFLLQVAAPGVNPDDMRVEVTPDEILVSAEVHHEHGREEGQIHVCEFAHGNLFRSIYLPKEIDPRKVKAEFRDGMLRLKAPVAEEARARKITLEAA